MEYVPGQDLEGRLLDRGPVPPEEVIRYATETALGLAHAHERGVIHRDIKPSNLLLGEDGRLRILDLGMGTLMDADELDQGSFATCDGFAAGTADYMSPEQAVGRGGLDGRSDLYSLGCVMYHLLSGQVPFPGESRIESLASRIKGHPVPLAQLRPGLPPDLVGIVNRLMATRRADRYATAAEAAEALRGLGACEPAPLRGEPISLSASATTRDSGSVSPESTRSEDTGTTGIEPAGWWLHFLSRLSECSPDLVPLAVTAALMATFVVGFLLSSVLR
jgi:serine/threonine-protein kinase